MKIDVHSETWRAVVAYALDQIERAQRHIEGPLTQPETDRERGRLMALRNLIAIPDLAEERARVIAQAQGRAL